MAEPGDLGVVPDVAFLDKALEADGQPRAGNS
jgi:hypothetical protein